MGYTHYFTLTRNFTADEWQTVTDDIGALLRYMQHEAGIPLANGMGDGGTSPEFGRDAITFNGVGDDAHETFTIDTVRDLGMRKPRDSQSDAGEAYHAALWKHAEEAAHEIARNSLDAPILNVWTYRQWERERREAVRRASCEQSKRNGGLILA